MDRRDTIRVRKALAAVYGACGQLADALAAGDARLAGLRLAAVLSAGADLGEAVAVTSTPRRQRPRPRRRGRRRF
jgi:hypothetical protein